MYQIINDVNIGNNPLKYSLDFANNNNKVVLHTDSTSNLFYHSTTDLPTKITVSQVLFKGIQNVANTSEAHNLYTMVPSFTTDTKSGNHAMIFDAAQQTALTFNNFTFDANNMTMSAWVKTDFTLQSNNPLFHKKCSNTVLTRQANRISNCSTTIPPPITPPSTVSLWRNQK